MKTRLIDFIVGEKILLRTHKIAHLIITCLLIVSFFSACQDQAGKADMAIIKEIDNIHKINRKLRSDSNFIQLNRAKKLISKLENVPDSIQAENIYLLGQYVEDRGSLDSAAIYYQQAIEYVKDSIHSRKELDYFYGAWVIYINTGKYADCQSVQNKLKVLLKEDDYEALAIFYYMEENMYKELREYESALENNDKRIEMIEKEEKIARNMNSALISRAEIKFKLKNRKEAYKILDRLIENKDSLANDDKRQLYGNYGMYKHYDGNYETAINYYLTGLHYTRQDTQIQKNKKKFLRSVTTSFTNTGGAYLNLKEYSKAKIYLDSAKAIGLDKFSSGPKEDYLFYHSWLVFETTRNSDIFLNALDTFIWHIKDDYNSKMQQELDALTISKDNERKLLEENKNKEISALEQSENIFRLIVAVAFLLLILLVGFLFYQRRQYLYEQNHLLLQQRLLRSQMNPHFIFNFLYAIQTQIKDSPKSAISYLTKFSRLLRLILENSMLNYVRLDKELESLTKYMDLQLLRFPGKFSYEVKLEDVEDDWTYVPPMLLQPIVENCIEHGFFNIDYAGKIEIKLKTENEMIFCSIEDNGRGLHQEDRQVKKESSSVRLISDFLRKTTKRKFEIINKSDRSAKETGVLVQFYIPFREGTN